MKKINLFLSFALILVVLGACKKTSDTPTATSKTTGERVAETLEVVTIGDMVVSNGTNRAIASDASNNLYVPALDGSAVFKLSKTDGQWASIGFASGFQQVTALTCDKAGNVYVLDVSGGAVITKFTPAGAVVYSIGSYSNSSNGFAYTDGPIATATFYNPQGIAVDNTGDIYVADTYNDVIRKIRAGVVSTFSGLAEFGGLYSNGAQTHTSYNQPFSICTDGSGNVYVLDFNLVVRKITPAGVASALAGNAILNNNNTVTKNPGFVNGTGAAAKFSFGIGIGGLTGGVTADNSGNVFVADIGNNVIRRITSAGVVTTYAGSGAAGSTDGAALLATFDLPNVIATSTYGINDQLFILDSDEMVGLREVLLVPVTL